MKNQIKHQILNSALIILSFVSLIFSFNENRIKGVKLGLILMLGISFCLAYLSYKIFKKSKKI